MHVCPLYFLPMLRFPQVFLCIYYNDWSHYIYFVIVILHYIQIYTYLHMYNVYTYTSTYIYSQKYIRQVYYTVYVWNKLGTSPWCSLWIKDMPGNDLYFHKRSLGNARNSLFLHWTTRANVFQITYLRLPKSARLIECITIFIRAVT